MYAKQYAGRAEEHDRYAGVTDDRMESKTVEEQERFDALRIWRNERARDLGYEAYMVASNDALLSVAKCPVETADDLLKIKGFGPRKVELYGEEIVALLNSI